MASRVIDEGEAAGGGPVPSLPDDDALIELTRRILSTCDPDAISPKQVRQQLERELGCCLDSKKSLIRSTIEEFFLEADTQQSDEEELGDEVAVAEAGNQPKPKRKNAFNKELSLAPPLAAFMGADFATRSLVTQTLWKYIKENDLQNPKDKRQIVCDAKLELIFKRKSVNMFTMAKLLAPMMKNVESLQEPKQLDAESEESTEEETRVASQRSTSSEKLDFYAKPQRKQAAAKAQRTVGPAAKGTGFASEVQLSTELAALMGCATAPRTQVTKALWAYIKEHDLQNPADRREILCDARLEALFKRKKVNMFQMNKLLAPMMKNVSDLSPQAAGDESEGSQADELQTEVSSSAGKRKRGAPSVASEGDDKSPKKRQRGFASEVQLSTELAALMGCATAPRTQVTKTLWAYIKEHDLQNPADRREILCDARLEALFKRKKVNMFQMNKVLAPMMKSESDLQSGAQPSDSESASETSCGEEEEAEEAEDEDSAEVTSRPQSRGGRTGQTSTATTSRSTRTGTGRATGFTREVQLSTELAALMGCATAPRTQVTKTLWAYIKEHDLQNPADRREILCDARLEALFKRKKVNMFQMNKLLAPHILAEGKESVQPPEEAQNEVAQTQSSDPAGETSQMQEVGGGEEHAALVPNDETSLPPALLSSNSAPTHDARGLQSRVRMSAKLEAFMKSDRSTRHDIFRRVRKYVKREQLTGKDKRGTKIVRCDTVLRELFRSKKVLAAQVPELLEQHIIDVANPDSTFERLSQEERDIVRQERREKRARRETKRKSAARLAELQRRLAVDRATDAKRDELTRKWILSESLARLVGVKHCTLPEVLQAISQYVVTRQLHRKVLGEGEEELKERREELSDAAGTESFASAEGAKEEEKKKKNKKKKKKRKPAHSRISCDEMLRSIFEKSSVRVTSIPRLIRKQLREPVDLLTYYLSDDSEDEKKRATKRARVHREGEKGHLKLSTDSNTTVHEPRDSIATEKNRTDMTTVHTNRNGLSRPSQKKKRTKDTPPPRPTIKNVLKRIAMSCL